MMLAPPRFPRTDTRLPYTSLYRSVSTASRRTEGGPVDGSSRSLPSSKARQARSRTSWYCGPCREADRPFGPRPRRRAGGGGRRLLGRGSRDRDARRLRAVRWSTHGGRSDGAAVGTGDLSPGHGWSADLLRGPPTHG